MKGYSGYICASAERDYEDSLAPDREAEALLENVRDLSGDALWKLADDVLGAELISDMIASRMADWEAYKIREAAKRAGVKL